MFLPLLGSFFLISSSAFPPQTISSEVVWYVHRVIQAQFEASALAAEFHSKAVNFHTAKMLPQFRDLFVL